MSYVLTDLQVELLNQCYQEHSRLRRVLWQMKLIRRRLDDLVQRYDRVDSSSVNSYVYSLKLKTSVTTGVWEMYKNYAKMCALRLNAVRAQVHTVFNVMTFDIPSTSNSNDVTQNYDVINDDDSDDDDSGEDINDTVEEFILDALDEEGGDDLEY